MRKRPRLRRLAVGAAVSLCTMLVLAIAVEVGVRAFVGEEVFSFRPVFRAHPVVGYTLKPNHEEYAFGAVVRSNSRGFRGPDRTVLKRPRTFRVALIGDSHAFGFGVPWEDSVGAVLERLIEQRTGMRCEVLAFAQPGWNARQELAALEEYALPHDPDLVIVVPCDNDHRGALWVDDEGWLRWGEPEEAPDRDTVLEGLWKPKSGRWGLLGESRALAWIKIQWMRWRIRGDAEAAPQREGPWLGPVAPGSIPDELMTEVYEPLTRIAERCRQSDVPVIFAAHCVDPDYRRLLARLSREAGAPLLELLGLFPDTDSWPDLLAKYSLPWDPHFDVEAHRRWAEALLELCAKSGFLPG